ncbi:hypothetical protein PYCCODRAFT_641073 [Trametes coccinea BRFM310]|uniref:F-box domain-containing protein n=1 Tax=Trametes coccinea (strain BRFM310) TaxID=1353009 RepID=A0A1Y2IIC0_TRAC3|nr:hypothetical protein PYCCODRAFT_641073 [Trametes coccinea BRFM310]
MLLYHDGMARRLAQMIILQYLSHVFLGQLRTAVQAPPWLDHGDLDVVNVVPAVPLHIHTAAVRRHRSHAMATLETVPTEIFAQICEDCDRRALFSLATTCRAISWPSLAILWKQLDSISPLLYTLPSDAITRSSPRLIIRARRKVRVINVTRELARADFERFNLYAPFIHDIVMCIPLGCDVTPDGWHFFYKACPGPLRNLRRMVTSLHIENDQSVAIPFSFLLGPALKHLIVHVLYSITCNPPKTLQPYFSELLASLPFRCPQLSLLVSNLNPPAPYLSEALADGVGQLRHLTSLHIETIPLLARAFVRLRSLPHLTSLKMEARSSDYPEGALAEGRSDAVSFPSLSILAVSADSGKCLISLLEYARSPSLKSLSVTICGPTTRRELTTIMAVIGSHPSRVTLENLAIRIIQVDRTDPFAVLSFPPSALQPLHALSSLRGFQLRGACHAILNDAAFIQFAHAWPHLEDLWLFDISLPSESITLAGVVEFACLCPSVQSIRLQLANVNHSECTALLARLKSLGAVATAALQHPVSLDIGRPSIAEEDIDTVAEILFRVFPTLERLLTRWTYVRNQRDHEPTIGEIMSHRWSAVYRNVFKFRNNAS